ncbi:MAG: MEDS domain-containing protein [Acidobacteria bacterium]|nr:MEDS domain-containing protein [Acidobacteriota bacterium]
MHIQTSDQPQFNLGFGGYSCNWGIHLCALYESEKERDEIALSFLCQGNTDGDLQLYCPAETTAEGFSRRMAARCPDCARDIGKPDRYQVYLPKDLYYPSGEFSPQAMDQGLDALFDASQARGPRNLRVVGEMVWARDAIPGVEHLMVYESRMNYFIPGKPLAAICMYNLNRFPGSAIMNVLRTHPFTISGGVIVENPYYQKPHDWLRGNAPRFANAS